MEGKERVRPVGWGGAEKRYSEISQMEFNW